MQLSSEFDTPALAVSADDKVARPVHPARPSPVRVEVCGEVDASNAHEIGSLAAALFDHPVDLVIDLSGVTFMASRGLWTVTELPQVAQRCGVDCKVVASEAVDHLLNVLDHARPGWVVDSVDEAIEAFLDDEEQ